MNQANTAAKVFEYQELCTATENFNPQNQLADGGFGKLYMGHLQNPHQVVAIRQLHSNEPRGNREFLVEILMLNLLHHSNLINLVGYCTNGDQRFLVYEYMANGSLEDHLFGLTPHKKQLDWKIRMKIAMGAAKGLQYLHETAVPSVIHRNIKASNILLDQDFNPKLSGFRLAKLGPTGDRSHLHTIAVGSHGYCDPKYESTGMVSTKSDVYSFGVVLLEIITGKRVIDNSRPTDEHNLVTWATPLFKDKRNLTLMADPLLEQSYPVESLQQAVTVAAMCLQEEPSLRPSMSDVVTALECFNTNN